MTDRSPRLLYAVGVGAVILVSAAVFGLFLLRSQRVEAESIARIAAVSAGPRVQVVRVARTGGDKELVLQGEARPFWNVTLYAKVSGYLRELKVDKGDAVSLDEVLARIESPELDRQYDAAVADAKYKRDNARRLEALATSGVASASDAELANAAAEVAEATVASLLQERSYLTLKAPFAGVVTARYADPGALVQAATSSQTAALPVVSVAQIDKLRVEVYVDQRDAPFVHAGEAVEVTLPERRSLKLEGRVARVSHSLDDKTRMMLSEIDLENPRGEVVPGSFVEVRVSLKEKSQTFVPVEALVLRGKTTFVALVSEDGRVSYTSVTVLESDGRQAYLQEGLREGQEVAVNLGDTLAEGEKVRAVR